MINIIFQYSNNNYMFHIDKNLITWDKLFDFINHKLQVPRNKIRFSINGVFFYGAKSLAIFAGILFAHAAVVMGTVIGLVEIFQD